LVLLVAVNVRREVLGLPKIDKLTADTKLDAGLSEAAKAPEFNKQSVLRDLKALSDATVGMATLGKDDASAILTAIAKLEGDPALLEALNRRSLIEKGLDLVDGPDCPLCDQPWDNEEHLREHLKAKLAKSAEAGKLHDALLKSGTDLAKRASPLIGLLGQSGKIAKSEADSDCASLLGSWAADLESFKTRLASLDGVMGLKDRLVAGWPQMPGSLVARLRALVAKVEAKPDQTATIDARTFLSTAQLRLTDYRDAMRRSKAAVVAAKCGKVAYDVYCRAMEDELNALYDDVQGDFSTYYRAINEGDEVKFTAKLTPSEGRLELDVNFYERGLFPPAAFHSEGHQDGMGICLYLALMKRLFGDRFSIALLDDVVMSVDSSHGISSANFSRPIFRTRNLLSQHMIAFGPSR
jgi:hypothetical protein